MADLTATVDAGDPELRKRLNATLPLFSQVEDVQSDGATGGEGDGSERDVAAANTKTSVEPVKDSQESQVKKVTEQMFSEMVRDLDEDVITKENLDRAVQNLTNLLDPTESLAQTEGYAKASKGTRDTLKKLLLDAIHRSTTGQVDYGLFGKVALRCIQGDMSLIDIRNIAIEHRELITEQKHASIGLLLTDPSGTVKKLYQSTLQWIERQGVKYLWSSFSTKHLYWLVAVYVLPMLTVSVIVSSVSSALFVGAMIAMVLTTIEIAMDNEKLQFQTEYVSLLQYFNNSQEPIKPRLNNPVLIKYVNFVVALVVAVITLEFFYIHPAIYSLLFITSAIAMGFVILQYDLHEHPIFFYFCITKLMGLLFTTAHKIYQDTPFLKSLGFLYSSLHVFPLSDKFSIHLDVVTLLQVVLHLYSLYVCLRNYRWFHVKETARPLVLLGCWYAVLRYFLAQSSPKYILAILVGSVALSVVPFLMAALFMVAPVVFFYIYHFTPPFFYSCGFVAIGLLIFAVVGFSWNRFPSFWLNLTLDYAFLMALGVGIPVTMYLSTWYTSIYAVPSLPIITVQDYGVHCSPKLYQGSANSVQTQINCLHMQGRVLTGEGTVTSIKISQMVDKKAASLNFLPVSLQNALTCALGEKDPMCGELEGASTCVYNGCHFQSSLQYTFEVKLDLVFASPEDTVSAKLVIPDHYKKLVLTLGRSSVVKFNATIVEGAGTDHLVLQTQQVSTNTFNLGDNDRKDSQNDDNEMIEGFMITFLKALRSIFFITVDMLFGLFH